MRVVVRPGGMSWIRAMADGLRPVDVREAVADADVVAVHLPEAEQSAMWAQGIAPHVAKGALVVFAHGTALYAGTLEPDPRFDVVLVAPGESPDACRVAVHQDATGRALERAASYARAVFAGAKVGTTTLASEVHTDRRSSSRRSAGCPRSSRSGTTCSRARAHEPDEATLKYYEQLRAAVLAEQPPPLSKPPSLDGEAAAPGGRVSEPAADRRRTGAQILWEVLVREGVDVVFGYPGGAIMPAYDAMLEYPIHHVLVRHEQGAAHMADGYARASRQGRRVRRHVGAGRDEPRHRHRHGDARLDRRSSASPGRCSSKLHRQRRLPGDRHHRRHAADHQAQLPRDARRGHRADAARGVLHRALGRPGPVLVDITKDAQQAVDATSSGTTRRCACRGYRPTTRALRGRRSSARSS